MNPYQYNHFEPKPEETVYQQVLKTADKARQLWTKYHKQYHLELSQAVVWALQNQRPEYCDERPQETKIAPQDPRDVLEYVSSSRVKDSVNYTLEQYYSTHRLEYYYHDNLNPEDEVRVRVLTNMIVYYAQDNLSSV